MARLVVFGLVSIAIAIIVAPLYRDSLEYSQIPETPAPFTCPSLDSHAALSRFRRLLTFPTTSNLSAPLHVDDPKVFRDMLAALEESFPLVWRKLKVEEVGAGGLSRLLTWQGSRPDLEPVLFVSHYDVVPVTRGTEAEWRHPPFSGDLAEGYVWGRGSADIKFSVAALLQAATQLLQAGFEPERTILFAFGHDEEVGGALGAGSIASLLSSRGVTLDVVVDEGGVVFVDGFRPLVADRSVALVGTAEKGFAGVEVVLRSAGGHSSMPPTDGSDIASQLWRLGAGLALAGRPPSRLAPPVTDMLLAMAPYAPAWVRPLLVAAGKNRFGNQVMALLLRYLVSRETAALLSSTAALTRIQSGVADNVLPQEAYLLYNCRLLPGERPEEAMERVRRAARFARVGAEVRLKEPWWPGSNVTAASGRHFQLLKQAIQETWLEEGRPPVAVAPLMLTGATDSKHYGRISRGGILRFVPYGMNRTAGDLGLVHGTNERIRAEHYPRAVCSYVRILELFSLGAASAAAGEAAGKEQAVHGSGSASVEGGVRRHGSDGGEVVVVEEVAAAEPAPMGEVVEEVAGAVTEGTEAVEAAVKGQGTEDAMEAGARGTEL